MNSDWKIKFCKEYPARVRAGITIALFIVIILIITGISKASVNGFFSDNIPKPGQTRKVKHYTPKVHNSSYKSNKSEQSKVQKTAESADKTEPAGLNNIWSGKRVLHIGDSMLTNWGLKRTLRKKFTAAGAKYMVKAKEGSNSHSWIVTGQLKKVLREKRPDIVIINLGTNAVKNRNPQTYSMWIKKLVKKIAPRECYWISPPGLVKDKYGFFNVLSKASAPCRLFDSRDAHFKRPRPKVFHLTKSQSEKWAGMIWKWLNAQSKQSDSIKENHGV